ncbi:MAG: DUF222 domain-containing protein [Streptosporangiaceae bacterium]
MFDTGDVLAAEADAPGVSPFAGAPGPELAAVLAGVDPAELGGYDLVEAIAGFERLVSWAQAGQLAAIAELGHRRPERGDPGGPRTRTADGVSEFCPDEIAPALRVSRRSASLRLGLAVDLCDRLPGTLDALAGGDISLPHGRVIADEVACLPDDLARKVEERVLGRAWRQTPGQLRASVARAVLAVDPEAADKRHRKAKADRRVTTQPLPDGMGELAAYLAAEELRATWEAVDAAARTAATAGDGRTMDQRRADALVDLLTGRCHAPAGQAGTPDGSGGRAGGGEAGSGRSAHTGAAPARPRAQVTVAATTLLGLDERPGELAGYGPIPASVARRIAADAAWRRLLTDPTTGALTEVGRRGYTPGAVLGDYIRARDATCRFPGCRQPASRTDIDHTLAWPDGATAAHNLACLCRHHHRLKQQPDWNLRQDEDGRLTWTTPTGHTYETTPPPVGGDPPMAGQRAAGVPDAVP